MLRQAQQSTHPLFRNFGTLRGGGTVSAEHIVTCFLFLVNLFELHSPASPLERGLRGVSLRIFIDTIAQSDAIDCNKKAPHCGAFFIIMPRKSWHEHRGINYNLRFTSIGSNSLRCCQLIY